MSSQSRTHHGAAAEKGGPWRRPVRRWTCLGLVIGVGLLAAGCRSRPAYEPMKGAWYLNPKKAPSRLGRVALVEFDNGSSYPEVSRDVSETLYVALQKKQQFGLRTFSQTDPVWRSLQIGSEDALSPEQCVKIHQTLQCDAVLTGVVTGFRPYPHLMIGLRLKMIDMTDGQLVWAVEQVWDSADRATEARIKTYLKVQSRSTSSMADRLMVVSTLDFMKFVAYEVAQTL